MFVGHMSTLKIIDKHEVLLTCHLKVKKKKKNKWVNWCMEEKRIEGQFLTFNDIII